MIPFTPAQLQSSLELSESINIGVGQGIKILLASTIAGLVLRKFYMRYSLTFSSPRNYGNTLLLVLVSVSSIIAIVKSSLALSLGLVGALSVVRFRTAVKEPYTLSYILLSVCTGIGIGAEQYIFAGLVLATGITLTTTLTMSANINSSKANILSNNCEAVSISSSEMSSIENSIRFLKESVNLVNIKSINAVEGLCSAVIEIQAEDHSSLTKLISEISSFDGILSVSTYNSPQS